MAKAPTSYIQTTGATRTRTVDALSFPFLGRPQATTAYVRFVMLEVQPVPNDVTTNRRIFAVGGTGDGRFHLQYAPTTNAFSVTHIGATGTSRAVSVTASAAVGAVVEIVAWRYTDGSVNLTVSVNGATAVTGTVSAATPSASEYTTKTVRLGAISATSAAGVIAIRDVLMIRGIHTLAAMRSRLGRTP